MYEERLLAETRFHRDALASLGPATRQHLGPAFGLHASPEPVLLRALAPVGLKCTFRHRKSLLLIESTGLRQTVSINDGMGVGQTGMGYLYSDGKSATPRFWGTRLMC